MAWRNTWVVVLVGSMTACSGNSASLAGPGTPKQGSTQSDGGGTSADGATATADGATTTAVQGCPTTLTELHDQVFVPACATSGCHSTASRAAGLDLETTDLAVQLLGVPSSLCQGETRVVPGDAMSSLLVQKINGTTDCGAPMPSAGPALPSNTIACIADLVNSLSLSSSGCETCGGSACVDLTADSNNCGACGQVCPSGSTCQQGACMCSGGLAVCGGSCVDTQSDASHCGSCNNDCGSAFCLSGKCQADCGTLKACGQSCVDTTSDARNCGDCGVVCGPGTTCQSGMCTCGTTAVSFAKNVQPVFTQSCASKGCHDSSTTTSTGSGPGGHGPGGGGGGTQATSSLDLTQGNAYNSLLSDTTKCGNVVVPGDPGASVLIDKLTGTNLCGGTQMPKGGSPLPDATISSIAAWICQGAKNN